VRIGLAVVTQREVQRMHVGEDKDGTLLVGGKLLEELKLPTVELRVGQVVFKVINDDRLGRVLEELIQVRGQERFSVRFFPQVQAAACGERFELLVLEPIAFAGVRRADDQIFAAPQSLALDRLMRLAPTERRLRHKAHDA
jgi:hypothetical protein